MIGISIKKSQTNPNEIHPSNTHSPIHLRPFSVTHVDETLPGPSLRAAGQYEEAHYGTSRHPTLISTQSRHHSADPSSKHLNPRSPPLPRNQDEMTGGSKMHQQVDELIRKFDLLHQENAQIKAEHVALQSLSQSENAALRSQIAELSILISRPPSATSALAVPGSSSETEPSSHARVEALKSPGTQLSMELLENYFHSMFDALEAQHKTTLNMLLEEVKARQNLGEGLSGIGDGVDKALLQIQDWIEQTRVEQQEKIVALDALMAKKNADDQKVASTLSEIGNFDDLCAQQIKEETEHIAALQKRLERLEGASKTLGQAVSTQQEAVASMPNPPSTPLLDIKEDSTSSEHSLLPRTPGHLQSDESHAPGLIPEALANEPVKAETPSCLGFFCCLGGEYVDSNNNN